MSFTLDIFYVLCYAFGNCRIGSFLGFAEAKNKKMEDFKMYNAEISRSNPSAILFLVDRSGSMQDPIAGGQGDKAKAVADAVNKLLQNLVIKCSKGDSIRDYFEVGVIGYGVGGTSVSVAPIFAGNLAGKELVKVSEVAMNPARMEERTKKVPDGDGGLVEQTVKSPIWFEPEASGGTPMTEAFRYLKGILEPWVAAHQAAFPPIVIHITDGESTDGDPTQVAKEVAGLSNADGNILVFNCHISSAGGQSVVFPNSAAGLLDPFAQMLFGISSELPESLLKAAQNEGIKAETGARGFAYQADLVELIQFLDIGTRPANNLR